MKFFLLLFLLLAFAGKAYAHSTGLPVGPFDIWHHWNFDAWIVAPLILLHWLYGKGVFRLWARAGAGRGVARWRVASFAAGEIILATALISPLDALGESLLSAHMVQHILLTAVAPPLLVLGAPVTALTWALPPAWRYVARAPALQMLNKLWSALTRPLTATALHAAALWIWHAPAPFDAAIRNETLHTLEHACFLGTALLFWSAMLRRATAKALAAFLVAIIFVQSGLLGAILTLAPAPLYLAYENRSLLWGATALEDQQLAGLFMWAPASLCYMAAFIVFASRAFNGGVSEPSRSSRESHGIIRPTTLSRSMK